MEKQRNVKQTVAEVRAQNSKAFFYICCERSARSVRGNG